MNLRIWIMLTVSGVCMSAFQHKPLKKLEDSIPIVLLFQFMWITIFLECLWLRYWPVHRQIIAINVVMAEGLISLTSAVTYSLFLFLTGRLQAD
jgi:hypothetical protein